MRALPCTRKGHPPLTRIGAKLSFCLWWGSGAPVGGVPVGNKKRKTVVLLLGGRCACRRRLPGGNNYAGSALHPQGTSSLDPGLRKKKIRREGLTGDNESVILKETCGKSVKIMKRIKGDDEKEIRDFFGLLYITYLGIGNFWRL